ncbi:MULTISPECIES: hypothetical protein [Rufibacter]|uniref:Lipoprotein n=1 Tax=Rufibacter quisquiliarum TaxID=1549639 RepID=A0A839GYC4_9BACT|nr:MULTISPECIES: hypothetical protein [Rufibacter]MBA9078681.1 hypothetical protein [Rufibacter quisquiliarum]
MYPFIKKLPFLALCLAFSACSLEDLISSDEPAAGEEGVNYVIESGDHETTNPLRTLKQSKLVFEVKFDSTAIYKTKNPTNQADINKLYGMSDCGSFHHTNSARFGWRWYKDRLELMAYSYADGKNTSTFITAIDLNKWYSCELSLSDSKYTFKVDGKKAVEHSRSCTGEGNGYQLYPYFGGDETAPHKINIKIKEKK